MCSQKLRKRVFNLLTNKCKRLIKLLELNAPDIIICNEIRMITNNMSLLEEGFINMNTNDLMMKIGKEKNKYGLCAHKGCEVDCECKNESELGYIFCEEHSP